MKFAPLLFILILPFCSFSQSASNSDTWREVKKAKKGKIDAYWYDSYTFIYENKDGHLAGVEYEIMEGFKEYLRLNKNIKLEIEWKKADSFYEVLQIVETSSIPVLGASAISITPEREQSVNFTPPYLSDIGVIITSQDVPIAKSKQELYSIIDQLKAVVIRATTYEQDLQILKKENDLHFSFHYIPSSENILLTMENEKQSFGYIDLPVYLTAFSRNTNLKLNRQKFLAKKRPGYALIYPKGSDWQEPLEEYFSSRYFNDHIETIISHYMDPYLYQFMRNLYVTNDEELDLLAKEKEIQSSDIRNKATQIEKEAFLRNILIGLLIIIALSLSAIVWQYIIKHRTNILLESQKKMIDEQRENIASQKLELEKRNKALEEINQEKNHLIKILAHDLRSPINQISGLVQLMQLDLNNLGDYTIKIQDATKRLHGMISKILDADAIETNRINLILEEIDCTQVIKEVISSYERQADLKKIHVSFDSSTQNLHVLADKMYLMEIMENLLSNSIKFSKPGSKIDIKTYESSDKIVIEVSDEGPGFTEEDKKYLFQKFKRLSAQPTGGEQSIGLGLSIVKKFTELMNGDISLKSQVNKGSTFILSLTKVKG